MNKLEIYLEELKAPESRQRMQAAWALGQLGDKQAIPALEKAIQDESLAVAKAALMALGRIGNCDVVDLLLKALNHENLILQKAAIQAIGKTGCGDIVPFLVNLLEEESLHEVARDALLALKVNPDFF